MKVAFRPSIAEHVDFLAERQKNAQSKSSSTVCWILFTFNLAVVPAILLFNDLYRSAVTVFGINAIIMIVLLSWQQKTSLRKYYKDVWPQLEEYDCEIGINKNGVECEHAGNQNFYPWKNVRSNGTTGKLVFFDVGPTQVLVSKRGFGNANDAQAFVNLAHEHKSSQEKSFV